MIRKYAVYYLLVLLVFGSCRTTQKPAPIESEDQSLGFDQMEEMKEVYYRFPSPDEMIGFIDEENLVFNAHYLLPTANATRYLDSKSQALNLGIYIADMAYVTLFKRQKEAISYFQVIYGLSDKLRMSSAFDPRLMRRFESNLNNFDSLKALSDSALNDIAEYLVRNEKEKTFAILSIGGYVESLYLAFNLAGGYDEKNPIIQRISDQKLVLENLINYALIYASDPNVADAIKLLHPIRSVYNELSVSEKTTSVTKDESGKLIISGGQKITISEEQYNKLKDVTLVARRSITENMEN